MAGDVLYKLLAGCGVLLILFGIVAYLLTGRIFDYALKRGTDPVRPPQAFEDFFCHLDGVFPSQKPDAVSEDWKISSFDGLDLAATAFRAPQKGHRWVVLVHGYGCDQRFIWNIAAEYLRHGYNVLTPDLRASGESDGVYLTMGVLESRDIARWADKIAEEDPQAHIVLHGISMGAATVMLALAQPLAPQVVAVVEDCGYSSTRKILAAEEKKIFGLPEYPLLTLEEIVCRARAGFSLEEAEPLIAVQHSQMPMMFIHGDEDQLVPYSMMQDLYEASASVDKRQWTAAGAGHATASAAPHSAYFFAIYDFIDVYTADK